MIRNIPPLNDWLLPSPWRPPPITLRLRNWKRRKMIMPLLEIVVHDTVMMAVIYDSVDDDDDDVVLEMIDYTWW
jgi:hypothetical protein